MSIFKCTEISDELLFTLKTNEYKSTQDTVFSFSVNCDVTCVVYSLS